jgi:hypothetical protein
MSPGHVPDGGVIAAIPPVGQVFDDTANSVALVA